MNILLILIIICMVATFGVMMGGAASMSKGGKHSNKMMQMRVFLQFLTIALIVLYLALKAT